MGFPSLISITNIGKIRLDEGVRKAVGIIENVEGFDLRRGGVVPPNEVVTKAMDGHRLGDIEVAPEIVVFADRQEASSVVVTARVVASERTPMTSE